MKDEDTLADCGVQPRDVLHLVLKLRGGGGYDKERMFVDMSNEAGLQHRQFDPSAPEWRIADRGLNLEGRCTNADCEAFDEMVIMQMGYGVFDVLLDSNADTTRCPCCDEFVQPLTCAFSRCEWKWSGLKGRLRTHN